MKGDSVLFTSGDKQFAACLEGLSKDFLLKVLMKNNVHNFKVVS